MMQYLIDLLSVSALAFLMLATMSIADEKTAYFTMYVSIIYYLIRINSRLCGLPKNPGK